ncbi:hypothetical protein PMI16_04834 [Herbaspirillum sp. CF444]|uniref:PIN domain-containing protein n=1 Tax=Herbaspirillum sp. CF444 TaxID=1144319 RepID=UPI000272469E|nr:PIN domain-containing protein [Herbaspirillum sp. CF444]EJL81228.1 hypothetical protein PMI16_04834 [Herbaspirillum sp. CF444]
MGFDTLVQDVAALGAPVLCADTCSILDVMRDPTRDDARAHVASATLELISKMEVGGGLVCLLADQVRNELATHLQQIQDDAKSQLSKLTERINRVNSISALFGRPGTTDLTHLIGHEIRAREIADRWIDFSKVVPQRQQVAGLAFARVTAPKAPARQGKDSIKDCVVIETYFDVIRALRKTGLQSTIVFLSSNTRDYTNTKDSNLHDELLPEFKSLHIEYASNAGAAKHILGF